MWRTTGFLLIILALSGCGTTSRIAHNDHQDDRREARLLRWTRPDRVGIHDPVSYTADQRPDLIATGDRRSTSPPILASAISEEPVTFRTVISANGPTVEPIAMVANAPSEALVPVLHAEQRSMIASSPLLSLPEGETSDGTNILAVLAFGLSIAGLVALSSGWGAYALVAGMLLGILALVLPAFRTKSGKFFAIAAIALPVLLLVVAIIALNHVWGS
jgi:ABC-type dipeptide/oligopeptide/nickel transport system permease subunit